MDKTDPLLQEMRGGGGCHGKWESKYRGHVEQFSPQRCSKTLFVHSGRTRNHSSVCTEYFTLYNEVEWWFQTIDIFGNFKFWTRDLFLTPLTLNIFKNNNKYTINKRGKCTPFEINVIYKKLVLYFLVCLIGLHIYFCYTQKFYICNS